MMSSAKTKIETNKTTSQKISEHLEKSFADVKTFNDNKAKANDKAKADPVLLAFHQALKDNYYALTFNEIKKIADQAVKQGQDFKEENGEYQDIKKANFGIALACYELAYLKAAETKTDNDGEEDIKNANKEIIFSKIHSFPEILNSAGVKNFNARINEPFSKELSNIERQIAINAFLARNDKKFEHLAEFYYRIALAIGIKKGKVIEEQELEDRRAYSNIMNAPKAMAPAVTPSSEAKDTFGNETYIIKAVGYMNVAANITQDPILKLNYQIESMLMLVQCQHDFYKNKEVNTSPDDTNHFGACVTKLETLKNNFKNGKNLEEAQKEFEEIKEFMDSRFYSIVKTILKNAADKENAIINFLQPKKQNLDEKTNLEHIKQLQNELDSPSVSGNAQCEYLLRLDQEYDTKMAAIAKGNTQVDVPADLADEYDIAIQEIKASIPLSQFFETFKALMTQTYLASTSLLSGKIKLEEGVLGKFAGFISDINKVTAAIAWILSLLDEHMLQDENKKIATIGSSVKDAEKEITKAALILTHTYKEYIEQLTTEATPVKFGPSIKAGAPEFAAFAAAYALSGVAQEFDLQKAMQEKAKKEEKKEDKKAEEKAKSSFFGKSKKNELVAVAPEPKPTVVLKTGDKATQMVDSVMHYDLVSKDYDYITGTIKKAISKKNFLTALLGEKAGLVKTKTGETKNHRDILHSKTEPVSIANQRTKAELSQKVSRVVGNVADLKTQVKTLEEDNKQKTTAIEQLKTNMQTMQQHNQTLQQRNEMLQSNIDYVHKENQAATQKNVQLEQRINEASQNNQTLQQKHVQLEQRINEVSQNNQTLRERNTQLEQHAFKVEQFNTDLVQKVNLLEQKNAAMEENMKRLEAMMQQVLQAQATHPVQPNVVPSAPLATNAHPHAQHFPPQVPMHQKHQQQQPYYQPYQPHQQPQHYHQPWNNAAPTPAPAPQVQPLLNQHGHFLPPGQSQQGFQPSSNFGPQFVGSGGNPTLFGNNQAKHGLVPANVVIVDSSKHSPMPGYGQK